MDKVFHSGKARSFNSFGIKYGNTDFAVSMSVRLIREPVTWMRSTSSAPESCAATNAGKPSVAVTAKAVTLLREGIAIH